MPTSKCSDCGQALATPHTLKENNYCFTCFRHQHTYSLFIEALASSLTFSLSPYIQEAKKALLTHQEIDEIAESALWLALENLGILESKKEIQQ